MAHFLSLAELIHFYQAAFWRHFSLTSDLQCLFILNLWGHGGNSFRHLLFFWGKAKLSSFDGKLSRSFWALPLPTQTPFSFVFSTCQPWTQSYKKVFSFNWSYAEIQTNQSGHTAIVTLPDWSEFKSSFNWSGKYFYRIRSWPHFHLFSSFCTVQRNI